VPKVQGGGDNGGRRGRGRRIASSLAEINVVPLVDVMLVLLIIFMVTAPMIQRGIDVNLPVARRASQIEGERVEITVPATYRKTRTVFLGEEEIRIDVLGERVRQRVERLTRKEVFLRGDGAVQLQDLMDVFDRLRDAGIETVGMVTKQPGEL
jgi:biopolymer transport protein ExbD